MNKRQIIMVTIILIVALIAVIMISEKNTQYLTCNVSGDFQGMESKTKFIVKVRKNKVKDMNMTIDVVVPEDGEISKEDLLNYINYQGKMKGESTTDGVKLTASMSSGYFDTLGLSKESSYSELKQILELQGYTCK